MGLSAPRPRWVLAFYPEAGEAGGCLVVPRRDAPSGRIADPDRAQQEAGRRARTQLRRYCAANGLNRLGTLTYAEACHDPKVVRRDVADFFRALRTGLGGKPLPYVWVPELHPGGHGFHLHVALGRYVPHQLIKRTWRRGFIKIKMLNDLPVGSGALGEARLAARYLSKYASKAVDERRPAGLHRYEVAEGFQPRKITVEGRTVEEVISQASGFMKRSPSRVWRSNDMESWHGPPACWVAWS